MDWHRIRVGLAADAAFRTASGHRPEGADASYVVLAWWDRENELPLRVFVREHAGGGA